MGETKETPGTIETATDTLNDLLMELGMDAKAKEHVDRLVGRLKRTGISAFGGLLSLASNFLQGRFPDLPEDSRERLERAIAKAAQSGKQADKGGRD